MRGQIKTLFVISRRRVLLMCDVGWQTAELLTCFVFAIDLQRGSHLRDTISNRAVGVLHYELSKSHPEMLCRSHIGTTVGKMFLRKGSEWLCFVCLGDKDLIWTAWLAMAFLHWAPSLQDMYTKRSNYHYWLLYSGLAVAREDRGSVKTKPLLGVF